MSDLIFGHSDISIVGGADVFPSICKLYSCISCELESLTLSSVLSNRGTLIGLELGHVINFSV